MLLFFANWCSYKIYQGAVTGSWYAIYVFTSRKKTFSQTTAKTCLIVKRSHMLNFTWDIHFYFISEILYVFNFSKWIKLLNRVHMASFTYEQIIYIYVKCFGNHISLYKFSCTYATNTLVSILHLIKDRCKSFSYVSKSKWPFYCVRHEFISQCFSLLLLEILF